jgi:predicted nucleic acid-binding protein
MIDALHIASAIHYGAASFVTNDVALRRVTEIPIVMREDFLPQTTSP